MKKYLSILLLLSTSVLFVTCLDVDDPNEQLNKEIAIIDQHISVNYPNDIVFYDFSGVRFVVRQFGNMPPAKTGQNFQIDIVGKVFGEAFPFQDELKTLKIENETVEGLKIVLQTNMVGSRVIAFVPSKLAYGSQGTTSVPPNSIIQYDLNLLQNELTAAQANQLAADTIAIRNYINANQITNVKRHPSGLYYKIQNQGSGNNPTVFSTVEFTYTGKFMNNGNTFDDGRINAFVFNLIDGFKVGLPLLKPGGKMTIYVPSYLGYGATQNGAIPANSVLLFEVDLNTILN